jgi:hypothetical protein
MPEIFQLTLNLTTAGTDQALAPQDIATVLQNAANQLLQYGYQNQILIYQNMGMVGDYKFKPSSPQGSPALN